MAVYDVNGDGLNDVVTSLQAHGLGLSWFEQKKAAEAKLDQTSSYDYILKEVLFISSSGNASARTGQANDIAASAASQARRRSIIEGTEEEQAVIAPLSRRAESRTRLPTMPHLLQLLAQECQQPLA